MQNRDQYNTHEIPTTCSACGEDIDQGEWHPTHAENQERDTLIHVFCDEDCYDEWAEG